MSSLKIKTLKKILIHEEWIKINFPFKMGNIVGFMCKKKKQTLQNELWNSLLPVKDTFLTYHRIEEYCI